MDHEDIRDALGELEPEEGARIALDFLRGIGRVVKVWERDDLRAMAEQDPEFNDLTEEEQSRVIDHAEDTGYFSSLAESNDDDAETLMQAVDVGMVRVKAERG